MAQRELRIPCFIHFRWPPNDLSARTKERRGQRDDTAGNSDRGSRIASAATLNDALREARPAEVIAAALRTVGRDRLALVSSFGTELAALLKVMADVDPAIPVIFLDTGWLFEETLAYRDTLIAALGLKDVRSIQPSEEA